MLIESLINRRGSQTDWTNNRRAGFDDPWQNNRNEVLDPQINKDIVETGQMFPARGVDGTKIGPIVDTGNAGITSVNDTLNPDDPTNPIRGWSGATFADRYNAPFRYYKKGNFVATSGVFTGTITAETILVGDLLVNLATIAQLLAPTEIPIIGGNNATVAATNQGFTGALRSEWIAIFANNTRMLHKDAVTATILRYRTAPTRFSGFSNVASSIAGASINLNIGCLVVSGTTEYLLAAADGGNAVYRYNSDGTVETLCVFVGAAPGNIRRMGFDPVQGYVYIMDGANKAATQIRRYTFSGNTLTNIASDVTLSIAPANAGSGNMLIGNTYLVLEDTASATVPAFQRYGKNNGTFHDTFTHQFNAASVGDNYYGMAISSDNRLYMACSAGNNLTTTTTLYLFDLG